MTKRELLVEQSVIASHLAKGGDAMDLIRLDDAAKVAGLSRSYVYQLHSLDPAFPKPAVRIGVVLFWRREAIERWNARRKSK